MLAHQAAAGAAAQGPCWTPSAGVDSSVSLWFTHENMDDSDLEVWYDFFIPYASTITLIVSS
jgi:hypothetical protein